jgi:hypothetical protein
VHLAETCCQVTGGTTGSTGSTDLAAVRHLPGRCIMMKFRREWALLLLLLLLLLLSFRRSSAGPQWRPYLGGGQQWGVSSSGG